LERAAHHPPLVITPGQVDKALRAFETVLKRVSPA
jgi:acetylornithine/succinyldiaminopimelate/putrescine aminotransferase